METPRPAMSMEAGQDLEHKNTSVTKQCEVDLSGTLRKLRS